jgi:hypothetical protein
MKSTSPIISAVVFGLSVFLLLMFGLGSKPSIDEVLAVSIAPSAEIPEQPEPVPHEPLPTMRPKLKGLNLECPKPVTASYRRTASAALSGLIVDEEGVTLAGADLVWVSLEEDSLGLRTSTQTELEGRFSFESAPSQLRDGWSAIWILHPSHYAEVIVLGPGEEPSAAFGGTQRLKAAPLFSAQVVDEVGQPVAGAEVVQVLSLGVMPPTGRITAAREEIRHKARQSFTYTTLTDTSGEALLAPIQRESLLTASLGDARSSPKKCLSEGKIELPLMATFEALGSVRGSFSPDMSVRCEGVAFGETTLLGEFPVGESGDWGPVTLPLMEVEEYVFSLHGEVAASQVRKPREEVMDRLLINFNAVSGVPVSLFVFGPNEEPLKGATTTVHWKQEGSWQSVGSSTDGDGLAQARGVPVGNVFARVHHSGHVSRMIGPFEVSPEMSPVKVHLEQAGQISGRCVRDGEPVESFQLLYWSGDPSQVAREEVTGSEDGTFFIKEAPLGEVTLVGLDALVANGSPQPVVVLPGEVTDVTIELPEPRSAIGEVIDAVTGDPIASARVQVMSAYDGRGLAEFGAEESSDAYGKFMVQGLSDSVGALRVRAEDYIEDFVVTRGGAAGEGELDLGLIALQPSRELVVQLDGPEGTVYGGFRVGLVGYEHLGVKDADHLGVVSFDDIPNGVIELNIYHPDQTITAFAGSLRPDDDGRILVPVSSGHRLHVQVLPQPGGELPDDLFVGVGGRGDNGSEVVQWLRDEGMGSFALENAQPGPKVIRAVALSGEVYAMRRFDLPAESETEIQLELGEEDDLIVRVIDSEDLPVSNAMVSIYLPRTDPCFFVRNLVTGSSGEVRVQGFGFSHAQVTVSHETKGAGDVGYVEIESLGGEPLVVRLEAAARLRVLVHDEGEPVVAATAALCATEPLLNGASFGERTTGQDGNATWESLMPGEYELFVYGVGLWPTHHRLRADANGGRQVLEVRRTGQLTFLLFDGRGHAVVGAEMELTCAELGASLSGWITEGKLSGASTITDSNGRLTLPPLPHGSWIWSAIAPDGRGSSGMIDLPAGELIEVSGLVQ